MVIAGAGASYDSIPSRPVGRSELEALRPPLADYLFDARPMFEEVQRCIPRVMPIVPALQHRRNDESVEDVLARYAQDVDKNPQRRIQLAAARFYIQSIIAKCEDGWYREKPVPTNIMALLDQIENARAGRARPLFVTFNYDRLIENALENLGQEFGGLDDYVHPERTNVIKLHGSVNWARLIAPFNVNEFGGSTWNIAQQVSQRIGELPNPGEIVQWSAVPAARIKNSLALPAIAIPTKVKDGFECPTGHLDVLKKALPRVRAIVTIGWRGAERDFLDLLREHALEQVEIICVAGTKVDAQETAANLSAAMRRPRCEAFGGGFSHFVREEAIGRLLHRAWLKH